MWLALAQFAFSEGSSTDDRRALQALCTSLRRRFQVACQPTASDTAHPGIVVAALGHDRKALDERLDAIAAWLETSAFGRIVAEAGALEEVDALLESHD